ncbi:hypothetical protein VP01_8160g1, partial [Puccinia sorghi]
LQYDPCPEEILTSCKTLKLYNCLSHGTCVIAPQNKPAFCKVKFLPFSLTSPAELPGWEQCVLLPGTDPVSNGLRKSSKKGEWFGRYCGEANNLIATHLDKLAPGFLEQYRQLLIKSQLPSFAHMEYPTPYSPLDSATFFTFT